MGRKGFTHEATTNDTDHWLTPPALLKSLGPFDLDPCAYHSQPWRTATTQYALPNENGLLLPWSGRVWCNPPYGRELGKWIERMALHDNGVMIIFARTETEGFRPAWRYARSMLYLYKRVGFCLPTGEQQSGGGAPSVLLAFGETNVAALDACKGNGWDGAHVRQWNF